MPGGIAVTEPVLLPEIDSPPTNGVWVDGEDHFTPDAPGADHAPDDVDRVDGEEV